MTVPPDRGQAIARAAAAIAAVTIAARAVGLLRQVVLARTVGPTYLGNTYQSANALPTILFEIVAGGALASLVVPVLAGPVEEGDRETTRRTASGLLTWAVVGLVPVLLLGLLLRRPLMSLLVGDIADPELRRAEIDVGARMLVVFMPQLLLYGVGIVLTGVLQAHRRFLGPALAPLLSSVVVIGAYFSFAAQGGRGAEVQGLDRSLERTLSVGTTLGVVALTLSLLVPLAALRLGLRPTLRLPTGVAPRVRRLAAAGAAGVVAQQLALVVVLRLANPEPGAVVVYQLAWTAFLLPWAVLAVPIATSAFPSLVATAATGDEPGYAAVSAPALRGVVVTCAGAAAMLIAVAGPAAGLLIGAQPVGDAASPAALSRGIIAFAPGLLGYGVLALVTRALYARDESRGPATATLAGFGLVVAADIALVAWARGAEAGPAWTVAALGAGNSLGMSLAACLLLVQLRRSASGAALSGLRAATGLAASGAVLAAAAGWLAASAIDGDSVLRDSAATAVGGLVALAAFTAVVRSGRSHV